jgi:hypothetical protein
MEDKMNTLKSLTFTTVPKPGANPTLDRRARTIERLEEQKLLLNDPTYKRTVRSSVKKDGERTVIEKHQRILPWWRFQMEHTPSSFAPASSPSSLIRARRQSPLRPSTSRRTG